MTHLPSSKKESAKNAKTPEKKHLFSHQKFHKIANDLNKNIPEKQVTKIKQKLLQISNKLLNYLKTPNIYLYIYNNIISLYGDIKLYGDLKRHYIE